MSFDALSSLVKIKSAAKKQFFTRELFYFYDASKQIGLRRRFGCFLEDRSGAEIIGADRFGGNILPERFFRKSVAEGWRAGSVGVFFLQAAGRNSAGIGGARDHNLSVLRRALVAGRIHGLYRLRRETKIAR